MDKYRLIHSMRCPKCGDDGAYVVIEDNDWWVATCDECGLHEGGDPVKMLDELFPDWYDHMPQTAKFKAENARLREVASRAWGLFLEHGAVHPCDLPEVDAVRDELRELGVEVKSDED